MTTLLTLEEAGATFPRPLSARSLRRELRRHGLPIVQIAGKHFVERPTLDELIQKCRVPASPPVSSSGPARPATSGSSETGHGINAQGWAETVAERLKLRSLNTSADGRQNAMRPPAPAKSH